MTYEEICNQDYNTLAYTSLLMSLALLKQRPIQAILFNTDPHRQTLIVIKQSPTGITTTKRITARNEDMEEIKNFLHRDFPYLTISYIPITDIPND